MINVFGCEFEDMNNIILFSIHFICKHHSLGSVRIIAINGDPPPLLGYGLYFGWIVTCKMYAILNSWKHTLNILHKNINILFLKYNHTATLKYFCQVIQCLYFCKQLFALLMVHDRSRRSIKYHSKK